MSNDDQLQALERLAKLRETGALSEEEFAAKKTAILSRTDSAHVSLFRKLWFVVSLTCLILTFPIALIILLTGDVYKKRDGTRVPISKRARYIYASVLGVWLAALIVRGVLFPSAMQRDYQAGSGAVSNQTTQTASRPSAPESGQAAEQPATNQPDNAPQPDQNSNSPNMRVEIAPTEAPKLIITGDDDSPFTITRLVFNGRAQETGCDYPDYAPKLGPELQDIQNLDGPFAKTLKRGEQAAYYPVCGQILSVDVYTDRGSAQYKFDQGN